jgi:hypothetical protein
MTLIPEVLQEVLKQGLPIEDLCSRYWYQYVIKPDILTFIFDGETVEELYEHCGKYDPPNGLYFDYVCAYIARNHYEIFREWMMNEQPNVMNILARNFSIFIGSLVLWHQENYHSDGILPEKIYGLLQKIFDDFPATNFDCNDIWSECFGYAIMAMDTERITYLIDIHDSIKILGNKDQHKKHTIYFNLRKRGKFFLKAYPQLDVTQLEFKSTDNLCVHKFMVKRGYKMKNEDFLYLLNVSYYMVNYDEQGNTKEEINEFFLENWRDADFTNEFIDECFAAAIRHANLKILEFLLENYNAAHFTKNNLFFDFPPGIAKENSETCHFLPIVIYNSRGRNTAEIVNTLLKYIDLSEFTDEVMRQIFGTVILARCEKVGVKLFDLVNPMVDISDYCKEYVVKACNLPRFPYNITLDTISLMIKFGCTIDEEYLHQILEFVDVGALDMILEMLNLTLDNVTQHVIIGIVLKHAGALEFMTNKIQSRINIHRAKSYASSSLKEKISEVKIAYAKHPICALYKISSMNDNGGIQTLDTKIDADLFVKLYKYIQQLHSNENLLERIDMVSKDFIKTVEKCYDHTELNKNNGKVLIPIVWSENANSNIEHE